MPPTDPSLFVRLMLRHQNDLLRYVLPLVGSLADAQDVVQEAALALWRKFDDYDPAQPFLPWARRFAHNEVLMHHRRQRRYTFLTPELVETLSERPERPDHDLRRQQALEQCLGKLAEADRRLLEARYARSDATVQQLADETGRSANVLYKSLGRIRRQLLDCVRRTLAAEGA